MDLRRLEEIALNASGPANPRLYDGWVLGFTPGKAKRGRSVNPFYGSTLPLEEKLEHCRALYETAGLPFVIRLTPFAHPADLEDTLAARGWGRFDDTLVMTRSLADFDEQPAALPHGWHLHDHDLYDWHTEVARIRGVGEDQMRRTLDRLDLLRAQGCGMVLRHKGEIAGWGMVQCEDGQAGIYSIETLAKFRRNGYGRMLVVALLQWARRHGATQSYLQVTAENAAALPLYGALGFTEAYRYWYRALPEVIELERG